jgi:ubiquinone/menaquinone biosynthesis C-methylase UbiE
VRPTTRLLIAVMSLALPLAALSTVAAARQQEHFRLFRPEDLGLLEPPDRDVWQRPEQIMDALQIAEGSVVADLGAGSGWFTIRLARRVGPNGKVYAEDIQQPMVSAMNLRIKREGLEKIVTTVLGSPSDPGLRRNALDAVLIVDAYHEMEDPVVLLRNVGASLKPGGRLGIVNFTKEGFGPGPPMEERVDPERVIRDAQAAGLRLNSRPDILPYQYLLVFEKVVKSQLPTPNSATDSPSPNSQPH